MRLVPKIVRTNLMRALMRRNIMMSEASVSTQS